MIHIAFEGVDGSGKTTLLREVLRQLRALGLDAIGVGKRDDSAMTAVTELIVHRDIGIDRHSEAFLRFAREHQRLARCADAHVVLLDRSLPSLASMIAISGLEVRHFEQAFEACRARMANLVTVLCAPPFAVAWQRMQLRHREEGIPLSRKEARGYAYNERIGRYIEEWAARPEIGGELLPIDTSVSSVAQGASAVLALLRSQAETGARR